VASSGVQLIGGLKGGRPWAGNGTVRWSAGLKFAMRTRAESA